MWLIGCTAQASCAPQIAHADPQSPAAHATAPAERAAPDSAATTATQPEPSAPSPAQAAAIEAELEAEHPASLASEPSHSDAAHLELSRDPSALAHSELSSDLAQELAGPPEPVACFVAEPVLEASAVADTESEPCGLVPVMPLGIATPIYNNAALASFRLALDRAQRGEGQARIVFYGASHVASDLYTGVLRKKLGQIAGNLGPGFVLPARPWRYYRNEGVTVDKARGFRTRRIMARTPQPDAYGLAGVAFDAFTGRPASASFSLSEALDEPMSMELFFMQRPHGGSFDVLIDGRQVKHVSTSGPTRGAGYATVELPERAQHIELRAPGDAPVRIFGAAIERHGSGVVLDTLGIPGSRAKYHLLWDDGLYRDNLAHRHPDLVVLAYGTNEAGDDSPIEQYELELRQVVRRIREVTPDAACLLIGPSDRPVRLQADGLADHERFANRPRTAQIVEVQRHVSEELGCGFFDMVEFMGGPLSMVRWVRSSPALGTPDHVHFTRTGYERMGNVLYEALMQGFAAETDKLAHKH